MIIHALRATTRFTVRTKKYSALTQIAHGRCLHEGLQINAYQTTEVLKKYGNKEDL